MVQACVGNRIELRELSQERRDSDQTPKISLVITEEAAARMSFLIVKLLVRAETYKNERPAARLTTTLKARPLSPMNEWTPEGVFATGVSIFAMIVSTQVTLSTQLTLYLVRKKGCA
jgi:hypothetical protein